MKTILLSIITLLTLSSQAAEFTISVNKAGQILTTSGHTCPAGSLPAKGQEVLKSAYGKLYSVITDSYGAASDADHFIMPNYDNQFLRGADQAQGGRAVGLREGQATAKNGLTLYDPGHTHRIPTSNGQPGEGGGGNGWDYYPSYAGEIAYTGISLYGDPETRPVNVAVLYCVAF